MKITYLDHSAFLAELEEQVLLFDWFRAPFPNIPEGKPVTDFISHSHPDHFSADVFTELIGREDVRFVLSSDVPAPRLRADITYLAPHEEAAWEGLRVRTLASTDAGVAFVVETEGKRLFHMGDLNWWDWGEEDTPEEAAEMERAYRAELALLEGEAIDLAFAPLDPRLGDGALRGIDTLMRTLDVGAVIPMHCWDDYALIDKLLAADCSAPYRDRILSVTERGQTWERD